jgi:hypothetical protein
MNLDIGNFRPPKVYDQIEMSIPHAVSTHIKTTVALDDGSGRVPFDLDRCSDDAPRLQPAWSSTK